MSYVPLHFGPRSHAVYLHTPSAYREHSHMSYELTYCIKGSFTTIIDKKSYVMNAGDLSIVNPVQSHETPDIPVSPDTLAMGIIATPALLEGFFKTLTSKTVSTPIFNINVPEHKYLLNLLNETYQHSLANTETSQVNIKGNIYKIFAYVYDHFLTENNHNRLSNFLSASAVQVALDYIRENYTEKISVKDIASLCGYSESTFSNTFKKITGRTFHSTLNQHRCEVACSLLRHSELSISEISALTGFDEAKNFCRTFKKIIGVPPSTYKKQQI